MQRGPKRSARRTPDHAATGCGGFQRRCPVGGAAYGMPLNMSSPVAGSWMPASIPASTCAVGGGLSAATAIGDSSHARLARAQNERENKPDMSMYLARKRNVKPEISIRKPRMTKKTVGHGSTRMNTDKNSSCLIRVY